MLVTECRWWKGAAKWKELVLRLKKDPECATQRDGDNKLLLHWAAEKQAGGKVVGALLNAYPDGAAVVGKGGWLPLHQAVRNYTTEVGVDVVKRLLEVYSEGAEMKDQWGHLPLHWATRKGAGYKVVLALLEAYPFGAEVVDREGKLPIHLAAGNNAGLAVVSVLLKAYPEGTTVKDRQGRLALQEAAGSQAGDDVISAIVEMMGSLNDSSAAREAWHEAVTVREAANGVRRAVSARSELAYGWSVDTRTAYHQACGPCQEAMDDARAFLGRYVVEGEAHRSATCVVLLARELPEDDDEERRPVALKLMRSRSSFTREVGMRVKHRLGTQYVLAVRRVHLDLAAQAQQEELEEQFGDGLDVLCDRAFGKLGRQTKSGKKAFKYATCPGTLSGR
jgi:ankyrin repeat protein